MSRPYRLRLVSSVNRAYSHDPLECIDAIGGTYPDRRTWTLTQEDAIAAIEAGTDEFFVLENGRRIKLVVFARGGQKYLRTDRADAAPDDLLQLVAAR